MLKFVFLHLTPIQWKLKSYSTLTLNFYSDFFQDDLFPNSQKKSGRLVNRGLYLRTTTLFLRYSYFISHPTTLFLLVITYDYIVTVLQWHFHYFTNQHPRHQHHRLHHFRLR